MLAVGDNETQAAHSPPGLRLSYFVEHCIYLHRIHASVSSFVRRQVILSIIVRPQRLLYTTCQDSSSSRWRVCFSRLNAFCGIRSDGRVSRCRSARSPGFVWFSYRMPFAGTLYLRRVCIVGFKILLHGVFLSAFQFDRPQRAPTSLQALLNVWCCCSRFVFGTAMFE